MKNIDIRKWNEFEIGNLFSAKNTGNILTRDVDDGSGTTPYVTASGINNGVVAYINASDYEIIKGNCILVGGKTFTLTYQANDFVSNDSHNFDLRLKDTKHGCSVYLFLITALRASLCSKYSWGDAVTKDKILKEKILLPSTLTGEPDFEAMENYIQTREDIVKNKLDLLQNVLNEKIGGGGRFI